MHPKVMIFGGTGFLGGALQECLEADGFEAVVVSRTPQGPKMRSLFDEEALVAELKECMGAVHLSGVRFGAAFSQKELLANLDLVVKTVALLCAAKVSNAVFASSIGVYQGSSRCPYCEKDVATPKNLYGLSKKMADDYLMHLNQTQGTCFKSLRLAQVLGENERKGYLLNTFMETAQQQQPLTLYGEGVGERQYLYVKDAALAFKTALEHPKDQGIYNVGMPGRISIRALADTINRVFENPAPLQKIPYPMEDASVCEMQVEKIHRDWGFSPRYSLEEALGEIRAHWAAKGA
ncbi:UDP-glucose 4-epimerase [Clostridiaceae bacterium JG1575]|nr:UDP-glucose 4-epimerase [Clostridiaceae bacterium JG1575]